MEINKVFSDGTKVVVSLGVLASFFFTMLDFTLFLSSPNLNKVAILAEKDPWVTISWSLLLDTGLLSLFVLIHSTLAIPSVKESIKKTIGSFYRTFYIVCTVITLQVLTRNWSSIPQVELWKYNISFTPFWWLYVLVHVFTWLFIYVGNICMDINELIGIKQLYYSFVNLPDPNSQKSNDLQRLNSHMRHPSFTGFLIILWSFPIMTLDRFLLASLLSIYMYIAWNTDERDFQYQKSQYSRKFHELEALKD